MTKAKLAYTTFLCLFVTAAAAQSVPPAGYTRVYDYPFSLPVNGYQGYTGSGNPDLYGGVEQCCGNDTTPRSLYAWPTVPACQDAATDPYSIYTGNGGTKYLFSTMGYHAPVKGCTSDPNGYWTTGITTTVDGNHTHGNSWGGPSSPVYIEWSATLPCTGVKGAWPGLYLKTLNQTGGGGEIDVIECQSVFQSPNAAPPTAAYSINVTDWVTGTNLFSCNPGFNNANLASKFNTYGVLITGSSMQFFFNRQPISQCTNGGVLEYSDANLQGPYYALFSLGVGGGGGRNQPVGVPGSGASGGMGATVRTQLNGFGVWAPAG
jgi:hypothetical protein